MGMFAPPSLFAPTERSARFLFVRLGYEYEERGDHEEHENHRSSTDDLVDRIRRIILKMPCCAKPIASTVHSLAPNTW